MTANFHFDLLTSTRAAGWVFSEENPVIAVEAWEDGSMLSSAPVAGEREDVAAAHGERHSRTGFSLSYRPVKPLSSIDFKARTVAGNSLHLGTHRFKLPDLAAISAALDKMLPAPSPFPPNVAKIIGAVDGTAAQPLSDEDQCRAADIILSLIQPEFARDLPDIVDYVRFIRNSWLHMLGVERWFPEINPFAKPGDHDYFCKTNSPDQMISIVHQIYVAKANGLSGAFAEFGCFKGFSTSMLSTPCARLGIPMLVFDSFEGLPPSEDATYKPGEFRGGLEEVQRNVRAFGNADDITWHKGFFSDSLRTIEIPALIQIWMDVDLYTSARDLAPAIAALDPRGAIFSHECDDWMYRDGRVIDNMPPSPGNVAPAITDKMNELGRAPVAGRFISGNTGAFWPERGGIPVLNPAALMKLVRAVAF